MGSFQSKIKRIRFVLDCLKKSGDKRFIKRVEGLNHENNLVEIIGFGKEKSGEVLYFIDMEESHSGFFAEHNRLLALLYFADQYHLTPIVRFHPGYCYAEKHPVNGTDNPFEYYFEQPCGISVSEMKRYGCVLKSRKENSSYAVALNDDANGYMRKERYLDEMARITAKYIRLNKVLREYIQAEIEKVLGNDREETLAVHVRGTDFKKNYNGHPIRVSAEEYLEEAKKVFQQGNYRKLFLATDDSEALELFRNAFEDRLVCYEDVVRSNGNDTVMNSVADRENHHYRLGVEVLRDMHTLAACAGLIAGLSQVSYAARIQKKSVNENYRHLCILDKGINYHQKENCPG